VLCYALAYASRGITEILPLEDNCLREHTVHEALANVSRGGFVAVLVLAQYHVVGPWKPGP
jgi:hypothetical protein